MNPHKICFITCVNDEAMYQESLLYIQNLMLPDHFEIEFIEIKDAEYITKAYNSAMQSSDAKYKVYLHQDVFIINKRFILDVVDLFNSNKEVGMIGVAGSAQIPTNGIWWESQQNYGKVYDSHTNRMQLLTFQEVSGDYQSAQCIDGLIMITQYDLPWRDEIFTGWHLYDLSHSIEFIRAGYKVGIPRQVEPWCIHDSGVANISNGYDAYRQVFLEEYSKDLFSPEESCQASDSIWEALKKVELDEVLVKWFSDEQELMFAKELILDSRNKFNHFLNIVKLDYSSANYEQMIEHTLQGSYYAHLNHPGFFSSPQLEGVLLNAAKQIHEQIDISIDGIPKKDKKKRNVLHVISEGYSIGGHTRLVTRWIEKDVNSVHSIAVTLGSLTNPQWLADAAIQSGGWYYPLDRSDITMCQRAVALRALANNWADIVVLHIHPHDPIPMLAFGIPGGPPVIFLNHADHAFWLGASIADLVVDIRPAGKSLTLSRRGASDSEVLPIPLSMPNSSAISKDEARKILGLDRDATILLSIASPYKYTPFGQSNFFDTIKNIVKKNADIQVVIVGPENEGRWSELHNNTAGRVIPMGRQTDLHVFHCAADIYVDSFSLSSLTAALEAGLSGLPIVGLVDNIAAFLILGDISTLQADSHVSELGAFETKIQRLIDDPSFRKTNGAYISDIIKVDHITDWPKTLEGIYLHIPTYHAVNKISDMQPVSWEYDLLWAAFQQVSGIRKGATPVA